MNKLQELQQEEALAIQRIHELERIISDESTSIVKRSKAKVELAQLASYGGGGVGGGGTVQTLISATVMVVKASLPIKQGQGRR